jgi:hypothetical protein
MTIVNTGMNVSAARRDIATGGVFLLDGGPGGALRVWMGLRGEDVE